MKYGFGVDLGGTTVKIAYFDTDGQLLHKWEIPTRSDNGGRQILPDIAEAINDFLTRNQIPNRDIIGIGIGVPGPIGSDGVVNRCVNLGWGMFNIEEALGALTGFPVKAGNDANVAALGECWMGGGKGCKNMVMTTLGTGVGGGIIIGGKILCGRHGAAGEIGHMVLCKDESIPCGCGKYGCVEQYCSATGIVRIAKRGLARDKRHSTLREVENLTCKDIFDAAAAEDQVSQAILEEVYDKMAQFMADLTNCLDPDIIVIGGGVSKAGPVLIEGIRRHLPKYIFHASSDVPFALASLGTDAGAYGAFKLVLDAR